MVRNMVVLGGSSHPHLTEAICNHLGIPPAKILLGKFSVGETRVEIQESVRGKDVYIIQSGGGKVNDHFMELLITISACKTASAKKVTAVLPLFPYSRQSDIPYNKVGAPLARVGPGQPGGSAAAAAGGKPGYTFDSRPQTPYPGQAESAGLANGSDMLHRQLGRLQLDHRHANGVNGIAPTRQSTCGSEDNSNFANNNSSSSNSANSSTKRRSDTQDSETSNHSGSVKGAASSSLADYFGQQQQQQQQQQQHHGHHGGGGSYHHHHHHQGAKTNSPQLAASIPEEASLNKASTTTSSGTITTTTAAANGQPLTKPPNFTPQRGYRQWVAQAGTLVADLLTCAGTDHVITMDLHDPQYQGFFDIPVDNLYGRHLLRRYIQYKIPNFREKGVIVSPDAGGAKRATAIADALGMPFALIHKERRPTQISDRQNATMMLVGDVSERTAILVDDLADTSNTITRAAKLLKKEGAQLVYALVTHGVLSGDAIERIKASALDKVVVTNSIDQTENARRCAKLEVLEVGNVFAEAIRRVHYGESISVLFNYD